MNIKMFCWVRNIWGIQRIGFKLKIIKKVLTKSTRFLCLALMIKYIQNNGCDRLSLGYQS